MNSCATSLFAEANVNQPTTIGVLALQGGFQEHLTLLQRARNHIRIVNINKDPAVEFRFEEVRNPADLSRCDALIIPGGESTTIALIASRCGLLEPLRDFVKVARKPTWGTCAGLILLSEKANATKKGGQELIGGLDVQVNRNHFGRQTESFVADLDLPFLGLSKQAAGPYSGVFIRAPVVERLLCHESTVDDHKNEVEVLAVLTSRTKRVAGSTTAETNELTRGEANDIVAVKQGNVVGTSFHPELTDDIRMHVWWLGEVLKTRAEH